jgi:aspartyl-tRNA synthetase
MQLDIETRAETPIPINDATELDKRLDWRFLDLRSSRSLLIFRIQTAIEEAMREYWYQNDFLEIHSPKLMSTASEGGSELFQLPYFDWTTASLAQSPQFYKQMAMMAGFDRVFEIGPVFRANKSFTPRHDTEFTSVDMEVAWINNHSDLMTLEENWLCHILSRVSDRYGEQIEKEFGVTITIPKLPFPHISLAKARRILASKGHIIPPKDDLDPQGERLLAEYVRSTFGHEFVFVTDFDTSIRPFYHMKHTDNPELTRSFDLIWKGTEITTGAQREHRLEILKKQILEKDLHIEPLQQYVNFFKYGAPPHGGMGVGLTRILMLLLGLKNVREVTYLFRGPTRLTP